MFIKWILRPPDLFKVITMFDGVFSSCSQIKELVILVLTRDPSQYLECFAFLDQIMLLKLDPLQQFQAD